MRSFLMKWVFFFINLEQENEFANKMGQQLENEAKPIKILNFNSEETHYMCRIWWGLLEKSEGHPPLYPISQKPNTESIFSPWYRSIGWWQMECKPPKRSNDITPALTLHIYWVSTPYNTLLYNIQDPTIWFHEFRFNWVEARPYDLSTKRKIDVRQYDVSYKDGLTNSDTSV